MLVARFDYHHFGVMPAFHVLGVGNSLRGYCLRMMKNLIRDFVFAQTLDQLLWNFHNRLRSKGITFPSDLDSLKKSGHRPQSRRGAKEL